MIWSQSRDTLTPKSINFRDYGHNDKFNKKMRGDILTKYKSTCRYCGGYYPKYLICSYLADVKLNDTCCKLCHMVTHLNYGNTKDVAIYYSELSQIDIVRQTVEYIISNNNIPQPWEIDINVKQSPISFIEFVNIVNNFDQIPEELNNYKIFFNDCLNLEFIVSNYGENMFINDDIKISKEIEKHICSVAEIEFFDKYLKN